MAKEKLEVAGTFPETGASAPPAQLVGQQIFASINFTKMKISNLKNSPNNFSATQYSWLKLCSKFFSSSRFLASKLSLSKDPNGTVLLQISA